MHGDIALVEASQSPRAFMHLVNLGLPFPRDRYGQFFGYQTDHDPSARATSIGPHTSREMCRALQRRVKELGIRVREGENAIQLLTGGRGEPKRTLGAVSIREDGSLAAYGAENIIFAVGGPGGLYRTSVYPVVHTGAIGVALLAGATAQNLPESQYGMASTRFRWNVSGTYMQSIPRFVSTAPDGASEEREFLREYFTTPSEMGSLIFRKGYQWPFDAGRVSGGSSIIDILVYIETAIRGRRVFLDYRRNPDGFSPGELGEEAYCYLQNSGALLATPLERLRRMNPQAIEMYRGHGIDVAAEPLEIAVCAQHNNGGLAGDIWWESINIKHLFPVGEVNGSHGVYRPGGSALNSGQVGGFRAAEYISNRYRGWTLTESAVKEAVRSAAESARAWTEKCAGAGRSWQEERSEFQKRMSLAGAHIRSSRVISGAVNEARKQWCRLETHGCTFSSLAGKIEALRNRQLCFAHTLYLDAIRYEIQSGVGSRGSSLVLDEEGDPLDAGPAEDWRKVPENTGFRKYALETVPAPGGKARHRWVARRPVPREKVWFETGWEHFREGRIYD